MLDEQTEMTIDELEMQKSGSSVEARRSRVTLHRGAARFSVGSPPDRRIELEVVAGEVGRFYIEPGARVGVSMHAWGARMICARGAVRCAEANGQSGAWVQAGDFLDFDQPAAEPQDEVLAESEARQEMAALLTAVPELDNLSKIHRALTPFSPQSR